MVLACFYLISLENLYKTILLVLDYSLDCASVTIQAEVAELVDALASGASGGNPVEVQVLSSAPCKNQMFLQLILPLSERYLIYTI